MEITLKNLKVAKFMSHETTCFQATIYVDGKKAGFAENEGQGGCTNVHLDKEFSHLHKQKFPIKCGCFFKDKDGNCPMCKNTGSWEGRIDKHIDHIVGDMKTEKETKTILNNFRKKGFKYAVIGKGNFVGVNAPNEIEARNIVMKKYPDTIITNVVAL